MVPQYNTLQEEKIILKLNFLGGGGRGWLFPVVKTENRKIYFMIDNFHKKGNLTGNIKTRSPTVHNLQIKFFLLALLVQNPKFNTVYKI